MSEGQHWYSRTGESRYDADLRVARKQGLVPSVTTVLSVIAKPALTNWLVNQGIIAALTGTRRDDETDAQYIARILADSKQQAIDAANEGTRIHDACERIFNRAEIPIQYFKHATSALDEVVRLFPGVTDWVSEKSFAHPLGFGGKCDLHSPSTGIIVDFKTKDGDFTDGKKLAWDQHWQLAAYQHGLELREYKEAEDHFGDKSSGMVRIRASGAVIFISRTHPGAVASHVWSAQEMAQGWEVFNNALALWKSIKSFDPSF